MIMNLRSKCLKITADLIKNPLNSYFTNHFDETIQSYKSDNLNTNNLYSLIVIETKINNKEYASALEWYNDIISMYQNAIKFSQNVRIQYLAQYLLNNFKKMAYGTNFDSSQWTKEISRLTTEINNLIEKSPVPQGIDPFVMGIVNYSAQSHQLTIPQSQWTINAINELCKNPDHLYDVFCILKQTKSDFDQTQHTITIDFDNLKPSVMNSLFLYAISFQQDNLDQINQTEVALEPQPNIEIPPNNQIQIIDQNPTEKIIRNPAPSHKVKNENLKVTPALKRASSANQVQQTPNIKEEISKVQTQNQLQLLHLKMQNQINTQNIKNFVNQLNQQNFQTQANQYDRLIRSNSQNQATPAIQISNPDIPIIIHSKQLKQNQQVQVDQISTQNNDEIIPPNQNEQANQTNQNEENNEQNQLGQQEVQTHTSVVYQNDQPDQPAQIEISIKPFANDEQQNQPARTEEPNLVSEDQNQQNQE